MPENRHQLIVRRYELVPLEAAAFDLARALFDPEREAEAFEEAASKSAAKIAGYLGDLQAAVVYEDNLDRLREHWDDSLAREGVGPFGQMRDTLESYLTKHTATELREWRERRELGAETEDKTS